MTGCRRLRQAWLAAMIAFLILPRLADAADDKHSIVHDGYARGYIVHTPPQYKPHGGASLPVVMALHGGGGSAMGMEDLYGLNSYADQAGMIVVYPQGVPSLIEKFRTWNAGACCGRAKKDNSDDTGFLAAVIDDVVTSYRADGHRVYVTGHSNGAMMAYRLACEIPGRIAGIAAVDGQSVFKCPRIDSRAGPAHSRHAGPLRSL